MAGGRRTRDRQRAPGLIPADRADSPIVRAQLARLWEALHSPRGDALVASLRRLSKVPAADQARIVAALRALPTTDAPASADRGDVARWLLTHALRRGLALPNLRHADLFTSIAELVANDEDIAGAADGSRNWRGDGADSRRQNQRKVMTRRSRLNARRRKAGYPNL